MTRPPPDRWTLCVLALRGRPLPALPALPGRVLRVAHVLDGRRFEIELPGEPPQPSPPRKRP